VKTIAVANTLLQLGFRDKAEDLNHLKLQKLLYVFNGWHLAVHGKPAIDEPFEAWPQGPVLPSLYKALQRRGDESIGGYLLEWDTKRQKAIPLVISVAIEEFWDVLLRVWDKYGKLTDAELSTLAHQPGSPWEQTRAMAPIDNELTRQHFAVLVTKPAQAA
jgi:uncharacterized phage-associated protein